MLSWVFAKDITMVLKTAAPMAATWVCLREVMMVPMWVCCSGLQMVLWWAVASVHWTVRMMERRMVLYLGH